MSLVQELQRDAYGSEVSISELLRKALFVARKLQIQELVEWINKELNGYDVKVPRSTLPDYRLINGEVRAPNMVYGTIPVHFSEQYFEDIFCKHGVFDPIGELESMVFFMRQNPQAVYKSDFTASQMSILRQHFNSNLPSQEPIMFVASTTQIEGILNSLRNIVLDWSIRLEEDGILGDGMSFTPEEKQVASTYNYQNCTIGALQPGNNNTANVTQNISSDTIKALQEARLILNQLPNDDREQAIELLDVVEGDIVQDKWTSSTKACAKELLTFLQAVGSGVAVEYLKNRLGVQ